MNSSLQQVLDYSEVWAPLVPMGVMLTQKKRTPYLQPIRIYVFAALFLNITEVLIWRFKEKWGLQEGDFLWSNTFIYNIHSICRFLLFAWFFIRLDQPFLRGIKKIVPLAFVLFALINFLFGEDFFYQASFSSRLLSLETGLLLLYCLQYYFYLLKEEDNDTRRPPSFWVVTGLSIYVVINFPIFLFYMSFVKQFENFAIKIWDVTNISFILLCFCLAKGFYESRN